MGKLFKVASTKDLAAGSAMSVEVEGRRVALFNVDGTYYAIDDTCTHRGGPLSEGSVEGDEVECPWHGAHFNIKSGQATTPPAAEGVATYKVYLAMPRSAAGGETRSFDFVLTDVANGEIAETDTVFRGPKR